MILQENCCKQKAAWITKYCELSVSEMKSFQKGSANNSEQYYPKTQGGNCAWKCITVKKKEKFLECSR